MGWSFPAPGVNAIANLSRPHLSAFRGAMREVPEGRRGTLSKRFVPSPSGSTGPPPPYDGGGILDSCRGLHVGTALAGTNFSFGAAGISRIDLKSRSTPTAKPGQPSE